MQTPNKKAFTLVELIVVITILAILGTIAFVSLQGYSRDSRNSVRITDIKTTETALELYSLQTGKYPLPDNYEVVTTTGSIDLWNKGQFDTELLRKLDRLSELPKDPKTEDLMGYSTTLQQKEYELKYNLELAASPSPNGRGVGVRVAQAISSNSYVKGNYNGLFVVGRNNAYYSTPGLFSDITDVTSTGTFDLHQLQTQYQVKGITNSGTLITTANLSNNQKEFAVSLKGQYANNPDLTSGIYEVLANLDVTSTGQLTQFTQAVTSGNVSSLIVAASSETIPVSSYSIGKSALFNGIDQYLSRIPAEAGDQKTWTLSTWIKRSKLGTTQAIFGAGTPSSGNKYFEVTFHADNKIVVTDSTWGVSTSFGGKTVGTFTDPSSWYHIVLAMDTVNSTYNLYVNGVLQNMVLYSVATYPSANYNTAMSSATQQAIGSFGGVSGYFDGYQSDIQFIDGQALAPTSFGKTNTTNNKWEPINYTGTYGTNGFHLDFTDNSSVAALGTDNSGNGNDSTVNNFATTDQTSDSPTDNYATLNPLNIASGRATLSNGNLSGNAGGDTGNHKSAAATILIPNTGKWYWEWKSGGSYSAWSEYGGIWPVNKAGQPSVPANGRGVGLDYPDTYSIQSINGNKVNNAGSVAYSSAFIAGDIMGAGYDADTGTLKYWKNGVDQGVAFTGINTSLTWSVVMTSLASTTYTMHFAEADMVYGLPIGYKTLSTANLSPVNDKIKNHFETLTYTGNGGTQTITGADWGTDDQLVWIKSRSYMEENMLFDTLRGPIKNIRTNNPTNELTSANSLTSFNNDGFNLGSFANANQNTSTYVAWRFRAGQSIVNNSGTIPATVSANPTLGFSIVKYIGNSTLGATVPHGLGKTPGMVIIKNLDSGSTQWSVWHNGLGTTQEINLNNTNVAFTPTYTQYTAPVLDNNFIYLGVNSAGGHAETNFSGNNYIAYVFADSDFIKIFNYTGNASNDGPFVSLGGKPNFIIQRANTSANWNIWDTVRSPYNPVTATLTPDQSGAEDNIYNRLDIVSNGFKGRTGTVHPSSYTGLNIGMAIVDPLGVGVSQ